MSLFAPLQQFYQGHEPTQARLMHNRFVIAFRLDDDLHLLEFSKDGIRQLTEAQSADVQLRISMEHWQDFLSQSPSVGAQSLSALRECGRLDVTGDFLIFFRHLGLLEQAFQSLRAASTPTAPLPWSEEGLEPIAGRYLRLNLEGKPHRIYFEEAGSGIPLLCLHTAGSDSRQYRHLLNDPEITRRFRIIAFDLPWHGKSSPPPGFQNSVYRLTTDRYVDTVIAVKRALELEDPVVMGCSIGGRAVLHLALRHGTQFKAAIGLQSAMYAESPHPELAEVRPLWRPDVHGGEASGGLMEMLIAPQSPSADKWETLWHYMQSGPGIFVGDLHYYGVDGDMRNGIAAQIDTGTCPLYLLTGEYDLSATPAMTQALAELVNAQHFEVMEKMGHFPMSENPELFLRYLKPVLDAIAQR